MSRELIKGLINVRVVSHLLGYINYSHQLTFLKPSLIIHFDAETPFLALHFPTDHPLTIAAGNLLLDNANTARLIIETVQTRSAHQSPLPQRTDLPDEPVVFRRMSKEAWRGAVPVSNRREKRLRQAL